jgi:hypothetical protein
MKALALLAAAFVLAPGPAAAEPPYTTLVERGQLHEGLARARSAGEVGAACRRLVEVGNASSVPHLINALHRFPEEECVEALERITGVDVGTTYAAWESWWNEAHPDEPLSLYIKEYDIKRWQLVYGFQVTTPQKLSASLGTIVSLRSEGFHSAHHGPEGDGLLLQIEPGLGGVKGAVGYGATATGGLAGWSARLAGLRTWGDPWGADSDATYVGPEATFSFVFLKAGCGVMRQVSGDDDDWLFTAMLGFGF